MSAGCGYFCIIEIFCKLSLTILERLGNRSPDARLLSLFLFFALGVLVNRASFLVHDRHFPSVAGLEDVLDGSCGSDAEDAMTPTFDDKSRYYMRYEYFRLAQNLLPLFGQVWP